MICFTKKAISYAYLINQVFMNKDLNKISNYNNIPII